MHALLLIVRSPKNGCAQLDVSHRMRDRASSFQRRSIRDQTSLRPLQGKLSRRVSGHARPAPSIAGKYPSGVQCQCMLQAMTVKMIGACRRSTLGYLLSPLIRYEHDSLRERFRPRASPAVGQGRELAGLYKPRWTSDHETQVGCPRGADWLRMHRRA